jgi:predicted oxidoreductase
MKYVPKRLVRTADVSRGRTSLRETLANFAIVLGSVVAAYAGLGVLADVVADRIPESWETRLAFLATRIDPEPDHEAARACRRSSTACSPPIPNCARSITACW